MNIVQNMAGVITLSDSSDDSDDLPSFADRVKQLINADVKEADRCSPLKRNISQIHSISDSEDSRDTVPFSKDRSPSPVCSSPDFSKFNYYKKNDAELEDDIVNLNEKKSSPNFRFDIQKDTHKDHANVSSDDDWPCLNKSMSPCSLPDIPDYRTNVKFHFSSDEEDTIKEVKKITKKHKEKKDEKEAEAEMRKKIRLEKKKERELMKILKASEKEILKNQKPEECLKNMKLVLDHNILYLDGSQSALNFLDQNNLKYSVEENILKCSVNWYRKVISVVTENQEILRLEKEELAETVVVIISNDEFLKMVHAYVQKEKGKSSNNVSLAEFVINVKSLYPGCDIACVTVGFSKFLRNIKDEGNSELKTIAKQIHKNASEEAVIELQLQSPINFRFLDDMNEFGSLLHHFTKAIAGAPQRKEMQMQKAMAFSWYADSDSHCPIKLSKDRSSFIKLWHQQVQQFQNVGPEVAEAIVSRYPSPCLLLKAYRNCRSTKDAENLLQDIVVRRNYGPLGTQKRIGPELSFKLHLFFTSRDGNRLLKR